MKVLISCTEYSAELLAAEIVEELIPLGDYHFSGIIGPNLEKMNVSIDKLANIKELNQMGFLPVLKNLPTIYAIRQKVLQKIPDVDAVIGIDSSSFNIPILREAKNQGRKSIGISSPQIWAWRKNRAPKIARSMDTLFCLFEFEPELYPSQFAARWEGHPIRDRFVPRNHFTSGLFGLLPGSRKHEIDKHLTVYLKTAQLIRKTIPTAQFICSTPEPIDHLPNYVQWTPGGAIAMSKCQAVLTKSGTCTLELAIQHIPMVVAHRINPLVFQLVKNQIQTPFIALPNILSKDNIVEEFIQELVPEKLAKALLNCSDARFNVDKVGKPGAAKRIANRIHRTLRA